MKKTFFWFLTIFWIWLIWYLTQYPNLVLTPSSFWDTIIADSSHFGFFGTLAILFYFALPAKIYHVKSVFIAVILTSIYGVVTEVHQAIVPGRMMDPLDWTFDTVGAILFVSIAAKCMKWGKRKHL